MYQPYLVTVIIIVIANIANCETYQVESNVTREGEKIDPRIFGTIQVNFDENKRVERFHMVHSTDPIEEQKLILSSDVKGKIVREPLVSKVMIETNIEDYEKLQRGLVQTCIVVFLIWLDFPNTEEDVVLFPNPETPYIWGDKVMRFNKNEYHFVRQKVEGEADGTKSYFSDIFGDQVSIEIKRNQSGIIESIKKKRVQFDFVQTFNIQLIAEQPEVKK